ncbi:UPF0606 protein KIAA1549 [Callorhinchus milii]|uniref:UPF0606 protein KIAA1549 n=1 Tax=Callorhinchus milii TaxID=7868 RepID=UPI001C3F4F4C|nr:UPF0606 protein KIAA1549 [Callorhinchus milii]
MSSRRSVLYMDSMGFMQDNAEVELCQRNTGVKDDIMERLQKDKEAAENQIKATWNIGQLGSGIKQLRENSQKQEISGREEGSKASREKPEAQEGSDTDGENKISDWKKHDEQGKRELENRQKERTSLGHYFLGHERTKRTKKEFDTASVIVIYQPRTNHHVSLQTTASAIRTSGTQVTQKFVKRSLLSDGQSVLTDQVSVKSISPDYTETFSGSDAMFAIAEDIPFLDHGRDYEATTRLLEFVETSSLAIPGVVLQMSSTSKLPRIRMPSTSITLSPALSSPNSAASVTGAINPSVKLSREEEQTKFNEQLSSPDLLTLSTTETVLYPSAPIPTELSGDDFGSGDYLGTKTISALETDQFALASSLVVDLFDPELSVSEVYDSDFPTRYVASVSTPFISLPMPSVTTSHSYSRSSEDFIHPSANELPDLSSVSYSMASPSLHDRKILGSTPAITRDLEFVASSVFLQPTIQDQMVHVTATTAIPGLLPAESISVPPSELVTFSPISSVSSFSVLISQTVYPFAPQQFSILSAQNTTSFGPNSETLSVADTVTFRESEDDILTSLKSTMLVELEGKTLGVTDMFTDYSTLTAEVVPESSSSFGGISSSEAVPSSETIKPTVVLISEPSVVDSSSAMNEGKATTLPFALPGLTTFGTTSIPFTVNLTTDITFTSSSRLPIISSSLSPMSTLHLSISSSLTDSVSRAASFLPSPTSSSVMFSAVPTNTITTPLVDHATTALTVTNSATSSTMASKTVAAPTTTTTRTTVAPTTVQTFLCDVSDPNSYLVTVVLSNKTAELKNVVAFIKKVLSHQFQHSVELQVQKAGQELTFMVTSGSIVFSAPAVLQSLAITAPVRDKTPLILSLRPASLVPDHRAQVHVVLQFVPRYVDVRFCNFTQRIERGMKMAIAEVLRRREELGNITVQVINVTYTVKRAGGLRQGPVNVTFAVSGEHGFLNGSDVSDLLRILSLVEFSFYLGFPVLKSAEPIYYPELNRSHLLKASWVRTVLLGVHDHRIQDNTFQADMERKLAQLLSEVTRPARRWKRASTSGNNTVQVVNMTKIDGDGNPAELIYFVEQQSGQRLSAEDAANLMNKVDIQRAAIVLGYRIQGALAQPVERIGASLPTEENKNLWIIVAVLVPLIVVIVVIVLLYWKFCRTDKLEFQPDTMSNIQQRQKLQAPCVKGFDFAKQHIGQHGKEDILVIHEAPPPAPAKDSTPSENGDMPSPQPKAARLSKGLRQRTRVSPSEAESTVSEQSSGRESIEDLPRSPSTPSDGKQQSVNKNGAPQISVLLDEQPSSASIFDHVDRLSRPMETGKRLPSKIQLIAMQPIPAPPLQNPLLPERVVETNSINKEVQRALRQKSEIEHHRNKIRLRAKRKGHYEFPLMDDVPISDTKERRRVYRRAQIQIDRILDPAVLPSALLEQRKSSRAKRSPRQRRRHQVNGSMTDAEKDRLITTDSDGTYKKPGVNNAAYLSDPDLPLESRSHPTPLSGFRPSSPPHNHSHPSVPPPYVPPQPSIEEARQQMHSLLDDAFALAGTGSPVKVTPAVSLGQPVTSTPIRATRTPAGNLWTPVYEQAQGLSNPYITRYGEVAMAPSSGGSHLQRSSHGPGHMQSGQQMVKQEHGHQESLYSNRSTYTDDTQSNAWSRPTGHSSGVKAYPMPQEGRVGRQTGKLRVGRPGTTQQGAAGWSPYGVEDESTWSASNREHVPRTCLVEPSVPSLHLQHTTALHPGANCDSNYKDDLVPSHSSTSLIKAIREELLRLSQKQSAFQSFHS